MRFVILGAALIAIVIMLVFAIGTLLPVAHTATRSAQVPAKPDRVYAALADPSWRKPDNIQYEVVTAEPPTRLVTRIADHSLPFGGEWEYTVAPVGANDSQVTIVERGEVYNPAFRFLSRFVFGYAGTMDAYLRELTAHLGGPGGR